MKQFLVHELIGLVRSLENLATEKSAHSMDAIPYEFRMQLIERTTKMQNLCDECGLPHSGDQFSRINDKLSWGKYPISYAELSAMLPEAMNRIEDETSRHVVMMIEPDFLKYFSDPQFFDSQDANTNKVSVQFPSAAEDIAESGKCLACGRATACVMHLNRVVEAGLKALAGALGSGSQNDWGKYLSEIDKELLQRIQQSGARTSEEQFYSEAQITIDSIRRAWRNPSMHIDRTYTEERAEEILIAVRSFMRHLATKLHD